VHDNGAPVTGQLGDEMKPIFVGQKASLQIGWRHGNGGEIRAAGAADLSYGLVAIQLSG
jgi:hypothetical protein